MRGEMDCRSARTVLFALVEDELTREERESVQAHLVRCAACRAEIVAESALTDLLGRSSVSRRPRVGIVLSAAAAMLVLAVLVFLPGRDEAYGAIQARGLAADLSPVEVSPVPLARTNLVLVPTGEARRIEIAETATLEVEGPATLDLTDEPEGWRLALLRGRVRAVVRPGARLRVLTANGRREAGAGPHVFASEDDPGPPAAGPTPEELLQQGHRAFFTEMDFAAAEKAYRAVLAHPRADDAARTRAGFYLHAALGRQGKHAEAVAVGEAWIEANPRDASRHYVLLFLGIYHQALGHADEARRAWETIVREAPDSDLAKSARFHLGGGAKATAAADVGYVPGRVLPVARESEGGYLVVRTAFPEGAAARAAWDEVAAKVAAHHDGRIVDFDGRDFEGLDRNLRRLRPENVLFVIPPDALDVVLHRRILLLSRGLDEDVFPDFAFGYFTARGGAGLRALWKRTEALHDSGLPSKTWISTAVTSGASSAAYEKNVPIMARAAGFEGTKLYFAFPDRDAKAWDFIEKNLVRLQSAGVVTMTGNGDPEGIWLFDDHRNVDRSKHWPYAPDRVGHDPEGEMPRILAERYRALRLASPIVWSGTCHSGATGRVYVQGDIVSTFGRTDRVTVHRLPAERSLGLAIVDAGAAAFLCPLGANHGMSVSREVEFALVNGATLGETIKSTYDDVCLAALEGFRLDLPVEGQAHGGSEPVMQGGGANRALIGDPALRPFTATPHPLERFEIANRVKAGFEVVVTWKAGWHPWRWDMFGVDRSRDGCIRARVPLDDLVPHDRAVAFSAEVTVTDGDGNPLDYVLRRAEPEIDHDRRFLHLQANTKRDLRPRSREVRATFRVTFDLR